MEQTNDILKQRFEKIPFEIADHLKDLEQLLSHYNPFNILANIIVNNQFHFINKLKRDSESKSPAIQEYLALICLKYPTQLRIGELTKAREFGNDIVKINELAEKIVMKHLLLHLSKYTTIKEDGSISDLEQFARAISSEELLVRNPTFDSYHWDQVEELYQLYNEYLKDTLGFSAIEGIRICETIADYMTEGATESMQRLRMNAKQMTDEIIAYKYRKKRPAQFYPDEHLEELSTWDDQYIRRHFFEVMATYEMTMLGNILSFTVKDIAEMEGLDETTIHSFLNHLTIRFGEINPDFTQPEVMHPLKDRPILQQGDRYLCSSVALMDYSLDRLFANVLMKDQKRNHKYQLHRHDYLLDKGVKLIAETLSTNEVYTNLSYPGGELDGLIFCDTNVFYIEAKGHRITDRAKRGFIDRISNVVDDIVKHSYEQGIRTHQYFFGKREVLFTDKKGRKVVLDGSLFKNAYFISLALEDVSSISCNLKLNNSLGLHDKGTFPWIVSLYDLRAICEHMEGPAYFIQYLHRRKEFFQYNKFIIDDELDVLGYYLQRNLRFDDLIEERYEKVGFIKLESLLDYFNNYHLFQDGKITKHVPKMKHFTIQPIKDFIAAVQNSKLPNSTDAAVQLLELGSDTKKQLLQYLRHVKKQYKKDGNVHDFRLVGDDIDGRTWMLSYMIDEDTNETLQRFRRYAAIKNAETPSNSYIAILDTSIKGYQIKEIIHYLNNQTPSTE